ncbi:MAG: hypothetical protein Q4P25_00250 [Tissierellia bacterium]|nr:hypothetical protein [Tissierellia bacterium]
MNYEENLNELKKELDKAKNLKYRAEARLEELESQKSKLLEEIREEGIEPENLEMEIKNLEKEIKELFQKANELMPRL